MKLLHLSPDYVEATKREDDLKHLLLSHGHLFDSPTLKEVQRTYKNARRRTEEVVNRLTDMGYREAL